MKKIGINGFGRIGRAAFKIIADSVELEVVGINDLMTIENAVYLLKYDSIYGKYDREISIQNNYIIMNGKFIRYTRIKDPADLNWSEIEVDVVIESTGFFTNKLEAEKHISAGAKFAVISGPSQDTPTIIHGVNTLQENVSVFSCGSCTTNNTGPIIEIIGRRIGIKKAILNTIHAFTASQSLVDSPHEKSSRMGRGASINSIPGSTGAATAVTKALPQFQDKFDGIAVRVPVPIGSMSDITFITERSTSADEINRILTNEAKTFRYKQVIDVSNEPLVSSDMIKNTFAATVDREMTRVVDGNLVKVMAWYDNEWGFTCQMIRQIQEL